MQVKLSEAMQEVLNKRYFKNNDRFTSERKKELINELSAMCEEFNIWCQRRILELPNVSEDIIKKRTIELFIRDANKHIRDAEYESTKKELSPDEVIKVVKYNIRTYCEKYLCEVKNMNCSVSNEEVEHFLNNLYLHRSEHR